jgi:predicted DNA-binding transcriptional regulator AlpA
MIVKVSATTYLRCMDGYLTADEVAAKIGVSRRTVYQYKTRGTLPPPDEQPGRTPMWKTSTIEQWIESRPGQGWRKGQVKKRGSQQG